MTGLADEQCSARGRHSVADTATSRNRTVLFAQESGDAFGRSFSVIPLIALVVTAAVGALLVLFIVLMLRYLRFTREKLHDERLKMIEAGYPLEEAESTKRRQQYMHNAFWISFWMVALVPSAAFSAAATATDRSKLAGYIIAIWIGASAASIAAVVCAAVLMVCSRCSRERDGEAQVPVMKYK